MYKYAAIYKIYFNNSNRIYIGSTLNYKRRKSQHLYLLRLNTHSNSKLQNYFNKYSEKGFNYEIIEYLPEHEFIKIREKEQEYLNKYFAQEYISNKEDNRFDLLTLNISPEVGKEMYNWTEERKEKQRQLNKSRIWSNESKAKMVSKKKGKSLSIEHKESIRLSIKNIRSKNKILKTCVYCQSNDTNRIGFRINKTLNITYQRFKCNNCKRSFK